MLCARTFVIQERLPAAFAQACCVRVRARVLAYGPPFPDPMGFALRVDGRACMAAVALANAVETIFEPAHGRSLIANDSWRRSPAPFESPFKARTRASKGNLSRGAAPFVAREPFRTSFQGADTCVTRQLPSSSSSNKPAYNQTNCSQPLVRQSAGTRVHHGADGRLPWYLQPLVRTMVPAHGAPGCTLWFTTKPGYTVVAHGLSPW